MTSIPHPVRVTPLAVGALRARMSLHETQTEFAKRFRVSRETICNWETGKTGRAQVIHQEILDAIMRNLQSEGKLISKDQVMHLFREVIDKRGLATA